MISCDFCLKSQRNLRKIFAGTRLNICDECVELSDRLLNPENPHAGSFNSWRQEDHVALVDNTKAKCSFCKKRRHKTKGFVCSTSSKNAFVCDSCINTFKTSVDSPQAEVVYGSLSLSRAHRLGYPNSFYSRESNALGNSSSTNNSRGLKCSFCGKNQDAVIKLVAGPGVYICNECVDLTNEILEVEIPKSRGLEPENFLKNPHGETANTIERCIEFPPEYRAAGTSILTYFSHVLSVKYPDVSVKVRIEQEGLTLRMIIDTPTGQKEKIERTLEEYGMVVVGQLDASEFLSDPIEVMALKNKIEISRLELKQAKSLFEFSQNNDKERIYSLESEVRRLHSLIEKSLQSKNETLGAIEQMSKNEGSKYDLRGAKFGGGFATEKSSQTGGLFVDVSSSQNLAEAADNIQKLLSQLQAKGQSSEEAQHQIAMDLAKQAKQDPTVMEKLVQWGKSLSDTAGTTTVSEIVKAVVTLALQFSGIPLP